MKVIKIKKYHALFSHSVYHYWANTLCSRSYTKTFELEDYDDSMDLCKICKARVFEKMVNKLKGKGN